MRAAADKIDARVLTETLPQPEMQLLAGALRFEADQIEAWFGRLPTRPASCELLDLARKINGSES